MKIDHKKDAKEVEVHMDIDFPNFPCHLLGLDLVDYIGTHYKDIHDNLKKIPLSKTGKKLGEFDDTNLVIKKS